MNKYLTIPLQKATLGENFTIQRAMPNRKLRMIGAWCFCDILGPITRTEAQYLSVAPHPHIGLQTFTWMLQGEIIHQDSLGNRALVREGEINLMTAGRGILHTEDSPESFNVDEQLHTLQLWIALPREQEEISPRFDHYCHEEIPKISLPGATLSLLAGQFLDAKIEQPLHSPLVALDIRTESSTTFTLPLEPEFEYGILLLSGSATLSGLVSAELSLDSLFYIKERGIKEEIVEPSEESAGLELIITAENAHLIIIGGEPLEDSFVMWWNYVASSPNKIEEANERYKNPEQDTLSQFNDIPNESRPRMMPPVMPARLLSMKRR